MHQGEAQAEWKRYGVERQGNEGARHESVRAEGQELKGRSEGKKASSSRIVEVVAERRR